MMDRSFLHKWRMMVGLLLVAVIIVAHTACAGPGYYTQAISGQLRLMHARQDIDSLIKNPDTDPALAHQLTTAGEILRFAEDSMDLPSGGSYSSYVEVEGNALVWNVVATPEFSLEAKTWCFPVAGCVPYRGYFKQPKALDTAARLAKKGLDVHVSPAAAYSTLGWFDDPLLSTMTSGSDVRLAAYLFHELAHQRLYIKGDGRFNEAYANFVEQIALRAWLEHQGRQEEITQWQARKDAAGDFRDLISVVRMKLDELYRSDKSENEKSAVKEEIFRTIPASLEQLQTEKWQGKRFYARWSEGPYNNARLALFSTYEGGHCAFAALWADAGGDAGTFHQLATNQADLDSEKRGAWLNQHC